ncbi:MAG: CbtA family protein, partial [Rhodobacteraceae bacterium]|nr:CbtA family protein [Paracoccaceae bacterium]
MLKKLVTSALFAGFGAGLIAAFLQLTLLVPILLEAEEYEHGNKVHFEAFMTEETVEPVAEAEGLYAEPSAWSRNSQTILWTTGIYVGFALMMVAGFGIAERFGHSVTARTGIIWGIGGFVALQFAPSAGLPPELPGAWA